MSDKKYKILIVEDEMFSVKALKKKLEDSDFQVLVAFNGVSGLEVALQEHPDLILLDLILPEMDGITMLDKLREDDWGKKVPVIILSNLSKADSIRESRERGVNTYLVKTDWKLDEVIAKVRNS